MRSQFVVVFFFFFFKQKTAYEMRISDWSSDVCSSDLLVELGIAQQAARRIVVDIAVAAQRLDGLQRHPGRLLGGEENRPGGVLARGPAAVAGSCHRVDV